MIVAIRSLWTAARHPKDAAGRVILTAGTNVALAGLALVTGVLVARLLGPEGRGQLAAMQVWGLLLYRVATLGLPDSIVYFIARDPKRGDHYLASAMVMSLMMAGPVIALGYVVMPIVLASQPDRIIDMSRVFIALFVPLYAFVNFPIHSLRGRSDFLPWNGLLVARQIGWLSILVVAWLIPSYDPVVVAILQLASLAVLAIGNNLFVIRRLAGRLTPKKEFFRPMLRFGIPSAFSDASELINLRVDQLVLAGVLSAKSLGFYVVAAAWGLAAKPLLTAVGNVLFPQVAQGGTPIRQVASFVSGVRAGSALAISITTVLLPLTPFVVPFLFGKRFTDAVSPAMLLVIGGTLWGLNGIVEEGLRGLGRPVIAMRAELGGAAATGILLVLLIPLFGTVGAAAASTGGFAVTTGVLLWSSARLTDRSAASLLVPDFQILYRNLRSVLAPGPRSASDRAER